METLKAFEDIGNPDPRFQVLRIYDNELCKYRDLTLADLYRDAAEIKLIDSVPEAVQSHFAQARNLLIYAWFHYQFGATAEHMALVTLEFALRQHFNATEKTNLKFFELLKKAAQTSGPKAQLLRLIVQPLNTSEVSRKVRDEADLIRYIRNEFAHGSNSITEEPARMVRYCAELINEIFANNSKA
jgi:hypothetical protein